MVTGMTVRMLKPLAGAGDGRISSIINGTVGQKQNGGRRDAKKFTNDELEAVSSIFQGELCKSIAQPRTHSCNANTFGCIDLLHPAFAVAIHTLVLHMSHVH